MDSLAEELTHQFYAWEQRGRGWRVFPYEVALEPPFEPFRISSKILSHAEDDGKQPTILSSFLERLKSKPISADSAVKPQDAIEAYQLERDADLIGWKIAVPTGKKITLDQIIPLLNSLVGCAYPISFEVLATGSSIRFQVICRLPDRSVVYGLLRSYLPDCGCTELDSTALNPFDSEGALSAGDFGLAEEFMRPLQHARSFEPDPLVGLYSIFEHLQAGERACIQIVLKGTVNTWPEQIIRSVTDGDGSSFFSDAPEMVKLAQEKVLSPLFGVVIRLFGQAPTIERSYDIRYHLTNQLISATKSPWNSLQPLATDEYVKEHFLDDIYFRSSHRLGMLLNSHELSTIVHPPSASIASTKLERLITKTKKAPPIAEGHAWQLGKNEHQGHLSTVSLSNEQRLRHMHVIGATGTGKSSFLLSGIIQDMHLGNGVGVIDPHGDLIEQVLAHIPEHRLKDVILIDPSDDEYPVGLNILTAHSELEKEILSSDLVAVFRRLSTSWGDQMNSVLANAILAFLESTRTGTIADLRRFLIEKEFRAEFLRTVKDPNVVYYWEKEFPIVKSSSIGPILTRLDTFLRPKMVRSIVAQKKSLDFENILNSQKILLVKLAQGLIGTENSYLLGTFIVAKMQQAAMSRQAKSKDERPNYFLYIDEFQNFITPSMSAILSGARKYHLGLILAHQEMQQLLRTDNDIAGAVISNSGTRVCFRLGDIDAKKLADGFASFEAGDLQNLGTGEAIVRVERQDYDFNLQTFLPSNPSASDVEKKLHVVKAYSQQKYGTKREEVEALVASSFTSINKLEEAVKYVTNKDEVIQSPNPIEQQATANVEPKQISQHRYLQTLIKKMAESRGYKALLEEPTPNGNGLVDVSLERNGKRIAVEIKDTSKDKWELQNIEKCLLAGYDLVVECAADKKAIERLRKLVEEKFPPKELERIAIMSPEEFFLFLDTEIAKEAATEQRVKGYRVKVEYTPVTKDNAGRIQETITKSVINSMKPKKGKTSGDSI